MGQIVDRPNPLIWYNGHMLSPKYKTGDVVQYNNNANPVNNVPMIILESIIKDDSAGFTFLQYRIMRGDEIYSVFENWIEPVQDAGTAIDSLSGIKDSNMMDRHEPTYMFLYTPAYTLSFIMDTDVHRILCTQYRILV